jgi:hypothetical protein
MNAPFPFPVETDLARLQRSFAEAILFDDQPIPLTIRAASGVAAASRFGVYRNNVIAGLSNAIAARYPVVRRLLSPETFSVIARMYATAEPPRSPLLMLFGDTFPQFLRRIGDGPPTEYVADIAELEAARTRAYHAADMAPVSGADLAQLDPEEIHDLKLIFHPSLSLLRSRFPIVTVWETNTAGADALITQWRHEAALVARPDLDVEVWRLSLGAYEFLAAMVNGHTIGSAAAHASALESTFALAESFEILVAAQIIVGIERSKS